MLRVADYSYADAVELLARIPYSLGTVVDLGAGKRDSPVSLQVAQIVCDHLISVEAFEPYIQILLGIKTKAKVHDVVKAHITHSNYKVKNCDLVLLIDVIEHLEKEEALELLHYLKEVAKSLVIFTVEGDTLGYSNKDMENPLQEHKSIWTAEEFEEMGFEVTVYENFHNHLGNGHVGAIWAVWKSIENG
jgi:hypothetical protein